MNNTSIQFIFANLAGYFKWGFNGSDIHNKTNSLNVFTKIFALFLQLLSNKSLKFILQRLCALCAYLPYIMMNANKRKIKSTIVKMWYIFYTWALKSLGQKVKSNSKWILKSMLHFVGINWYLSEFDLLHFGIAKNPTN